MPDDIARTLLDRSAAQARELATLRAEVAAVRAARHQRPARRRRHPTVASVPATLLLALLLALVPTGVLAVHPFTDLDPAQAAGHNPNIDAIYNAGITRGCNPPDNDNYCPTADVTRQEMASFLARTAGLGGNPPVANAATAVSAQNAQNAVSAQTATNATNAANAAQLGGQPASAYVRDGTDAFFTNLAVSGSAVAQGNLGTQSDLSVDGSIALGGVVQSPRFRVSTVITRRAGALPLTSDPFIYNGGALLIFVTGSGYRTMTGGSMDIVIEVVGRPMVGYLVGGFTNEVNSHKPIVGTLLINASDPTFGIPPGTHRLRLAAALGTVTDASDTFSVTVLELPLACSSLSSCP